MSPTKIFKTNPLSPINSLSQSRFSPANPFSSQCGDTLRHDHHKQAHGSASRHVRLLDPQPMAVATCGSAGLCRAGRTDSELPLEKDSDLEGTGGSNTLPVCLDWPSGELWLVSLNLSSTCIRELGDITQC